VQDPHRGELTTLVTLNVIEDLDSRAQPEQTGRRNAPLLFFPGRPGHRVDSQVHQGAKFRFAANGREIVTGEG